MTGQTATDGALVAAEAIAIIGMAGRFPGADTLDKFWSNLVNGVESITRMHPDQLDDSFPNEVRACAEYVPVRPLLEDVEDFDAAFFNMYAREAELTDPQQRLFLECSWEALEDGGCDPQRSDAVIGVFAGCSMNTYFLHHICADPAVLQSFTSEFQLGNYPTLVGAGREFLATRVSYKLDLRGPSFTVQSACSTSLLAVAQACQSLLLHQADLMLAGGASISFPQHRGYLYQEGGMASADGHCRPFDAQASGTVFGSGVGVVLLKRLSDARADGDRIYAVIRGSGVSNDGAGKVGFTAPSIDGQAAAIRAALAMAEVPASTVSYIECHGTATPMGDPIEVAALAQVYGASAAERDECVLGSVKSNVGHLDAAAGVVGLIKTALCLQHGMIPPTLHYQAPNPQIDLAAARFAVNAQARGWPSTARPRRAAISALGVGGTNVHLVLEQAPEPEPEPAPGPVPEPVPESVSKAAATAATVAAAARPGEGVMPQLLVLSARSVAALAQARMRLAQHLRAYPQLELADVAWTLQRGRHRFEHRCSVVADNTVSAADALATPLRSFVAAGSPALAFMFPGQGAQYPGMGRALYASDAVFREAFDGCAARFDAALGIDLRAIVFADADAAGDAAERLRRTDAAQPALFTIGYALAQTWRARGLKPQALIGHSVGEFVAATVAGVFRLEDAIAVIAARARLMQSLPPGAMLAVRADESTVQALLIDGVSIAAINAPALCVLSGPLASIERIEARLQARGLNGRRLHTAHAFHSAAVDPIIEPLRATIASMPLAAPTLPFVSCVSGDWISDAQAQSPDYWATHARQPVRFADGITTLLTAQITALLEVGPGSTLTTLALQAAKAQPLVAVASLGSSGEQAGDRQRMLEALGRLWCAGIEAQWASLHRLRPHPVSLPTYPFERARHWVDAAAPAQRAAVTPSTEPFAETSTMNDRNAASIASLPSAATATATDAAEAQLCELLETLSGQRLDRSDVQTTFLELGFDSLFLTQVSQRLQTRFGVRVSFRQLLNEFPSVATLASHLAPHLGPQIAAVATATASAATANAQPAAVAPAPSGVRDAMSNPTQALFLEQLSAMSALIRQQLQAIGAGDADASGTAQGCASTDDVAPGPPTAAATVAVTTEVTAAVTADGIAPTSAPASARHPLSAPAQRAGPIAISQEQHVYIDALAARCRAHCESSRRRAAKYRSVLADPRAVADFRAEWKALVFPVVAVRAQGSRIWDLDGNEYVDLVNDYGQAAFGHAPDFVVAALRAQIDKGFAIAPQAERAGAVAELLSEMTGHARVSFFNSAAQARMAAIDVARTVTGRDRVVVFGGGEYGDVDQAWVEGVQRTGVPPCSLPGSSGITASADADVTVLDYGTDASLQWLGAHAGELAAVIVEPVQSRHPAPPPLELLQALRAITERAGTAFVMDEVVSGFRVHPDGAQGLTGIRADLAIYGEIVGGGLPIAILAGSPRFMDAVDGGHWNYDDDSVPASGVSFGAGTIVRHPLALATAHAVLQHLRDQGPALQRDLDARTAALVSALRKLFTQYGIIAPIEQYSSLFHFDLRGEHPLAPLLFHHLRLHGVLAQEGTPCFLTTAHSDADVDRIIAAFRAALAEMAQAGIFSPVVGDDPTEDMQMPLTESQLEIWLATQPGDEASAAFNESLSLRFEGNLDRAALQSALDALLQRHEALRARFAPTGESQRIVAQAQIECPLIDLSALSMTQAETDLAERIGTDARTPFDLVGGPVIRTLLVRLAPQQHVLVLTAHHIICDGWSFNVLVSEFGELYRAALAGVPAELPAAPRFSRYARTQAARPAAARQATEGFWLQRYAQPPAATTLPADRPRGATRSFAGGTRCRLIAAPKLQAIKTAGARQRRTLFATLLAGFYALVGRLSGAQDVVVAVPTAGQSLAGAERLVGHCVHFLPLRARWDAQTTAAEHLQAVSAEILDAFEHQNTTLGTLVGKLALPREGGRLPLTQLHFNVERMADSLQLPGASVRVTPNPKAYVNDELFINVIESPAGLRMDCNYNTDLFDAATIDRWLECYEALLTAILAAPEQPLTRIAMLSPAQRAAVLDDVERTHVDYPPGGSVLKLIAAQAAARPHALAVQCGDLKIDYAAMVQRVTRLAQQISASVGARDKLVAVAVQRGVDLPVSLLAVWQAGCAYVPLDLSMPAPRLKQILGEAEVAAVLTDQPQALATLAAELPQIRLPEALAEAGQAPPLVDDVTNGTDANALAYVIYTSGSTGTPKGVEITQAGVANFIQAMARTPGLAPHDRLLALTTIAFDIAALELFLPLCVGAGVIIASAEEQADVGQLQRLLERPEISTVQATPSGWRVLLEAGFRSRPGFRMLCGGEALSRQLADRLLTGGGELWNLYGPTETTIWSSCVRVLPAPAPISVGAPIANTQFLILDAHDQLLPVGVPGHLHIGGAGLARGYHRQPALSAERFIDNPYGRGRLYRSGDLAKRLADGSTVVLGRLDDQIKLRGFRIELGDVEVALQRQNGVVAAAAALRMPAAGGEAQLVAYYVERPGAALDADALRAALAAALPDYMVPASLTRLGALPLTPNGKLDRSALPQPQSPPSVARSLTPPRSDVEKALATIWGEVLHPADIGLETDVLTLGADSIQLFQIVARAHRADLPLSTKMLLQQRRLDAVAAVLTAARQAAVAEGSRGAPSLRDFRRRSA